MRGALGVHARFHDSAGARKEPLAAPATRSIPWWTRMCANPLSKRDQQERNREYEEDQARSDHEIRARPQQAGDQG